MMRLLRFLITGDWHLCKYEIINTATIRYIPAYGNKYIIGDRYILQCNVCGKMKTYDAYEE